MGRLSMADLVTLEQVARALRLDLIGTEPAFADDERTPDITMKIAQAQDAIIDYLKVAADKWTAETVPPRVVAAIILAVRGLLDGEDDLLAGLYSNERGNPIVGLLWRSRDPALA